MKKYLGISVDCDLRMPAIATRQAALDGLLDVFEQTETAGRITWFLNENDFKLTENHESFLHEAIRRGDTLGVHDHVDFLQDKGCDSAIHEFCARSLRQVKRWLKEHQYGEEIPWHRMGCLYQRPECYRALGRLGYTVVSEVYPGYKMPDHAKDVSFDNLQVPAAVGPWRHDSENFLDHRSRTGQFLHLPVFHMFTRDVPFKKLEQWIEIAERGGRAAIPFIWIFHPYEICAADKSSVAETERKDLEENIRRFIGEYHLEPANFRTLAAMFGG